MAATDCLISLGDFSVEELLEGPAMKEEITDPFTVLGCAVPAPISTAQNHGVYVLPEPNNEKRRTDDMLIEKPIDVLQKPSIDFLLNEKTKASFEIPHRSGKQAWIDVGIVIFFPKAFQAIKEMSKGLLTLCTRKGLEAAYHASGSESSISLEKFAKKNAVKVDIYTDILHNFPAVIKKNDSKNDIDTGIKKVLSAMSLRTIVIYHGSFLHLGSTRELLEFITNDCDALTSDSNETTSIPNILDKLAVRRFSKALKLNLRCKTFQAPIDYASSLFCSTFPSNTEKLKIRHSTYVEYSDLEKYSFVSIGSYCMVSGWRSSQRTESFVLPCVLSAQFLPLAATKKDETKQLDEHGVMMVLGITDSIKIPARESTIYGVFFDDFINLTGVSFDDLGFQDPLKDDEVSIWSAKIHPVVLFNDSGISVSFSSLFGWLQKLREGNPNLLNDKSLANWKAADRVSLKDLHELTDAVKLRMFQTELESKILHYKCEMHVNDVITAVKERNQYKTCNIQWFSNIENREESFAALCTLVGALENLGTKELLHGNYDISGRAFTIASSIFDENLRGKQSGRSLPEDTLIRYTDLIERLERSFSSSLPNSEEKLQAVNDILQLRNSLMSDAMDIQDTMICSKILEHLSLQCIEFAVTIGFMKYLNLNPIDRKIINFNRTTDTIIDRCVVSISPVRVDLAGGWSDTPPICYEYGGSVTGMAVLVDGCFPLSCRCRIISGGIGILLKSEIRDLSTGSLLSFKQEEIENITQLRQFRDPLSSCALLKASLICLGVVTEDQILRSTDIQTLINQFCSSNDNVRIEIVTTSLLGMGTGMGTSSILGACVFQSVAKVCGIGKLDDQILLHAVLMLEQILSSGGGWQDQTLGIVPGVKRVHTSPKLPIDIKIEQIELSSTDALAFERRLLFVYTGKTRLAKNILKHVLRRWSRRTNEVVEAVQSLVQCSSEVRDAFLDSSWDKIGELMYKSYKLKCSMAGELSGAEPEFINTFISEMMIRNQIKGATLCGAGGGGFLLLLLSEDVNKQNICSTFAENILPLSKEFESFSFHKCSIATTGLQTFVMDDDSIDYKMSLLNSNHN